MKIELSPKAAKYLSRLDKPTKGRLIAALEKLTQEPPEGDIKSLVGKDGFRLRVGQYRVLFDIMDNIIVVHEIGPRGQIYKGGK